MVSALLRWCVCNGECFIKMVCVCVCNGECLIKMVCMCVWGKICQVMSRSFKEGGGWSGV